MAATGIYRPVYKPFNGQNEGEANPHCFVAGTDWCNDPRCLSAYGINECAVDGACHVLGLECDEDRVSWNLKVSNRQ